jgi:hypothetical protein
LNRFLGRSINWSLKGNGKGRNWLNLFCQPTHGRFRLRAQTTVAHFKQEIVELFVAATLSAQVHRSGSFVIKQTLRTAMLASALAATALDATAQDGDVAAGPTTTRGDAFVGSTTWQDLQASRAKACVGAR